jgi:hypothetical protein
MEFQDEKGRRLDLIQDGVARLEEKRDYRFAVQLGEAAREGWKAWFGELELEWDPSGTAFVMRTGHWVGSQSLRVQGPQGEQRLQVEVRPRSEKLSGDAWAHLLRDLDRWLQGSTVGREGGLHGEVGFSGSDTAGVASVLGELVPAFLSALETLLRAPRERSVEHWTEAPVHSVRQADRETLRWLVRHPDVYQSVLGRTEERREGREVLVPRRAWRGDLDHAANRYVVWLAGRVASRLRETGERLGKGLNQRKSLDPDLKLWCQGRIQRLAEGAKALDALVHRPPLGGLPSEPPSDSALLTLADDPAYARVHAFGQLFLSPRFQLPEDEALLKAPVRPSYELYELWTFLALQRLLEEHLPGAHWTKEGVDRLRFFDESPNGASFTAHWPGRGRLGLYFNQPFPGFLTQKKEERWSISGARRPDLVVTWRPEAGQGRWLCLDAKYRTGERNMAEAFESAHLYRDALRWRGLGERGRCSGAVLLVPSMDSETAPWFEKDFRDEHSVGAFCLTPGQRPPAELVDWFREQLGWDEPATSIMTGSA